MPRKMSQTAYNAAYYKAHKQGMNRATVEKRRERYTADETLKESDYTQNTDRWYRRTHGVSFADFLQQVEIQKDRCPIGNHLFGPRRKGQIDAPVFDHDHETGNPREILCRAHNIGLGYFHDSIEELESAITYLKKHQGRKLCLKK